MADPMSCLPRLGLLLAALALAGPLGSRARAQAADPAEVTIGERLFLETRFAQFFAAHCEGDVNATLSEGDPALATTEAPGGPLPGPFAGQSMNCRACHLVDEQLAAPGGGARSYADFAVRSPIPEREDGRLTALRNTPSLVNATLPRKQPPFFLHFDGEFRTTRELVAGTLTGRNYGWLPGEHDQALAHIAAVLRGDDGTGSLAQEFGGSYALVLRGKDPSIPPELRLPKAYRVDVSKASDKRLLKAVGKLIAAYVDSLRFAQDEAGVFTGSPYDVFLAKNALPAAPAKGETPLQYGLRLKQELDALEAPAFVDESDGSFALHAQDFVFGAAELDGLRVFLTRPAEASGATSGVGNCIACHAPPDMTDFAFHNTGATQLEYDGLHGAGSFAELSIPDWATRKADPLAFLPPSAKHPEALGPFAAVPGVEDAALVDLGLWNVFLNPDCARPQSALKKLLVQGFGKGDKSQLLARSVALFKTPALRDLGDSGPYLHNGLFDELAETAQFYADASELARAGLLRNADLELTGVHLAAEDVQALAAFLAALNEDYD
jgi:cytochrome c peroxidase